ncbi:MAG: PKD domain-containing protein [Acidiferrobacterales bacterium]
MNTNLRLFQSLITCLLLSLLSQSAVGQLSSGRARIYDAFGVQQGANIDTIGAGRLVSTASGFAAIDEGDTRLRIYNVFGELQNRAVQTNGPAEVVPHGNLLAVIDDTGVQLYTLFGFPQGARIPTNDRADVVPVGNVFVVIEDRRVRIFGLFGNEIGSTIQTNDRATVVRGNTRFAVIDTQQVRIYDVLGNLMGRAIRTSGAGEVAVTRDNIFVVTDDAQVRFFNLLGNPVGSPVRTDGRANISLTTDRIVVVDTRVRIYRERDGGLVRQITTAGRSRVVTNIVRIIVIDNDDRRVRIYDLVGNLVRTAIGTGSRADVVVSVNNRLVIIEDGRVRILDPFGSTVNDNIRTNGRADIATASDKIFVNDEAVVRIFDHFGVPRGRTFDTVGRAEVIVNISAIGIHDDNRVRIYNHLRNVDGGTISTQGNVSLATSVDRIAILDGQDEAIEGLSANNDSPTSLGNRTTLMASVTAGTQVGYSWDFGDGATGSGAVVTHVYAAAGTYTATVTASNGVSSATASTVVRITSFQLRNDARFIAQSVPTTMQAGETATVSITMENTGTSTWTAADGYQLGAENPPDNSRWGLARVLLARGDAIASGQRKTFIFEISAPTTAGTYNFQWRMLQEEDIELERELERFGNFTPNVSIKVTKPSFPPWEEDRFDSLRRGPLHGQNGWFRAARNRASAIVVPAAGGGNLLHVDPRRRATIVMGKNVPDQVNGRHVFGFRVRVTGATTPSIAKIEMQTRRNFRWDKKFQIYFGNSMRLNYGRDGRAVVFLAPTESGRWYAVECLMDLDTGVVDVRVDGVLVAAGIPMHPGPITSLGLSGWDRAGAVRLDDLVGSRIGP